ncbi:multidrug effflux MFS transporter [Pontibacter sp. JAM-7]|uniref:multidrug effflux MFS transporter n=1 Tax=Pontibacter sp. JAM-7 TaxID=3366581 RepID=UPI003AF6B994
MQALASPTTLLIYLLAALTAMAPLAVDAYLPALPEMAMHFSVSIHDAELSLSIFLAGFACGQLIGGPFSDHAGRRIASGCGISLFCLGSLGIMLSSSMESVWLFRGIQALGGGLAVVNSSAVIRDLSHGRDSARHLSNISVIMMLAPLLAPMIGALLLHLQGWRLIFEFLLVYGVLIGAALYCKLPETRRPQPIRTSVLARYAEVLSHRYALGFVLSQCFAFAGMFAFITSSPLVYMQFFDVSEAVYPLLFGANIIGMISANRLNIRLLHRFNPHQILTFGQLLQLSAGLSLLGYLLISATPWLPLVVMLIVIYIGAMGLMIANATSSTIEFFPHSSATATAILGASGFAMGGVSGALVGLWGDGTPLPMATVMLFCSILGIAGRWLLQMPGLQKQPE